MESQLRKIARLAAIVVFASLASLALAQKSSKDQPGFLGVILVPDKQGAMVEFVFPDSPAEKAGLRIDDVVSQLNGAGFKDVNDLVARIAANGVGASIKLSILRDGKNSAYEMRLADSPFVGLDTPDKSPGLNAVRIVKDIAYYDGKDADGEKQKLNLFFPETKEPFPVMMWIYGGAWSLGDRTQATALAMRFAERGVGVAAIGHRLSDAGWSDPKKSAPGVIHPEHVRDCARAFAWLLSHVKEYGGDPERLFVGGHSSGAHLAVLLATNLRYLGERNIQSDKIKGAVALDGVYDIEYYHQVLSQIFDKKYADAHIHAVFGTDRQNWQDASPVYHLAGNTVPMLIVSSGSAYIKSFRMYAESLKQAAQKAGVRTILFYDAANRNHGSIVQLMSLKSPDPVRQAVLDFIRKPD